jgi:hypothetical protein|tara:strand:+ start:1851 stop:2387 length:537 start_codon:yes stop_codon:yes gene_type:complete
MDMDERLKKELGAGRGSRAMSDRAVTERRDISDDDRLQMFQQALFNDALPDLPNLPGYHLCWLTTTNTRDPIHRRMQLGYEPVKPEEVPGMQYATLKTGEWSGFIAVNEMLAFKLPMSLYQRFMQEAHHDAPLREEQSLADQSDAIREQLMRSGSNVTEGDGLSELRQSNPARGVFTD